MITDTQLQRDCELAIGRLGSHPDVLVLVTHSWVSLRGSVQQGTDRWKVEEAVSRVPGVVGTSGQMSVHRSDDAAAAERHLPSP